MTDLTHVDASGRARMVDVSDKPESNRRARAGGWIRMRPETLERVARQEVAKGDVLSVARIAGIMAAKRTAELIPLCHPLPLTSVQVDLELDAGGSRVLCEAVAQCRGATGVEMEALAAVQAALLTVYDMCKAVDRGMVIEGVRLLEKSGGRSGDWRAPDAGS